MVLLLFFVFFVLSSAEREAIGLHIFPAKQPTAYVATLSVAGRDFHSSTGVTGNVAAPQTDAPHTEDVRVFDFSSYTSIDRDTALRLIHQWDEATSILAEAGIIDDAQVTLIVELFPEIVADLVFSWLGGKFGDIENVQIVLNNVEGGNTSFSMRDIELYGTLRSIIYTDENYSEFIKPMVDGSALTGSILSAVRAGKPLKGATSALAFPGLLFDGTRVIKTGVR